MSIKHKDSTDSPEDSSDEFDQWKAARKFASLIGELPRFIRATIHFLKLDVEDNNNELSFRARSCLLPLLRSNEFTSVLYYSAKTFFPERVPGASLDTPRKLATLFKPDEFIAIISVMYLYRRMKKGCEKESFQHFMQNNIHDWLLAGGIGRAIGRIGFADGLIYGTFPQLAQCLFLGVDRKAFKKYRVHVRLQHSPFDLQREEEVWKCNCLQVAVLLAQSLGLGRDYHDPFMMGLASPDLASLQSHNTLYAARLLQVWIEALRETGEAPDMLHRGEFYPFASEMQILSEFSREIKEYCLQDFFAEKGKKSLSPENTPELFASGNDDSEPEGTPTEETNINTLEELPEEIRDDFPEDIDLDEVLS